MILLWFLCYDWLFWLFGRIIVMILLWFCLYEFMVVSCSFCCMIVCMIVGRIMGAVWIGNMGLLYPNYKHFTATQTLPNLKNQLPSWISRWRSSNWIRVFICLYCTLLRWKPGASHCQELKDSNGLCDLPLDQMRGLIKINQSGPASIADGQSMRIFCV